MVKIGFRAVIMTMAVLAVAGTAKAQGGCVDSPECPTAVLAFIGMGATILVRRLGRYRS
jgi:XrtJ-associated TM-motif-TM protein